MDIPFLILAALVLGGAVSAMTLRYLVHCALALAGTVLGLAGLYLRLSAQFIGFAQVLVYVGAIAILILFVILLTRGPDDTLEPRFGTVWVVGVGIAASVFGLIGGAVLASRALSRPAAPPVEATVHAIGNQLMTRYVLALEVIGVLLTAALIGAVLLALREKENP
jgi:NADH-quinone oxidoreductase subunit J